MACLCSAISTAELSEISVLTGAPARVTDKPRFRYRAFLIDTARNYITVPTLIGTTVPQLLCTRS